MYQVYQDGKPADSTGYPEIKSWPNSKFDTFVQAVTYAIRWAYPYKLSDITAQMIEEVSFQFENNNFEVDMGMTEFPIMMSIREI